MPSSCVTRLLMTAVTDMNTVGAIIVTITLVLTVLHTSMRQDCQ